MRGLALFCLLTGVVLMLVKMIGGDIPAGIAVFLLFFLGWVLLSYMADMEEL